MTPYHAYVPFMACQVQDNQISHFMVLLCRRLLTLFSISSLFQVSPEHARPSAVPRSLIMLLFSLRCYAYIRALSVLLSRIPFMFLTAGTEDLDLGKRAG